MSSFAKAPAPKATNAKAPVARPSTAAKPPSPRTVTATPAPAPRAAAPAAVMDDGDWASF
jgi:hypothetical protein